MADRGLGDDELRALFERWMDSEIKIQLLEFFHNNPGVIETVEGLAVRLGTDADRLADEVEDQIEVGILKKRTVGGRTALVYDKVREGQVQRLVADRLRDRLAGGEAS